MMDLLSPGEPRNNDYYDNLTGSTKLGFEVTSSFDLGLVARYTETIARSNFPALKTGDRVNLEYSLRIGDRMGGHFVYGHVDAAARVLFARPLVPAARAAVPTETRGRPNDTLDSTQEVADRVSSLLHASSAGGEVGPGVGGDRGGGVPGAFGSSGLGSRSSPSGAAFGKDFADDPGFSGYSRALRSLLCAPRQPSR